MIKIILLFVFMIQVVFSQIITSYTNFISIEKNDYCKNLYNEKRWVEKQLDYQKNIIKNYNIINIINVYYIEESVKDLNTVRKEISHMIYQLCNYYEL